MKRQHSTRRHHNDKSSFKKKAALLSLFTMGMLGLLFLTSYSLAPEEMKQTMLQLPEIAKPEFSLQNLNPIQMKLWKKVLPDDWIVSDAERTGTIPARPEFNFTLAFLEFSGGNTNGGNDSGTRMIILTESRQNGFGVTPIGAIIREKVIELVRLPYENGSGGGDIVITPANIIIVNQTIFLNQSAGGNSSTGTSGSTGQIKVPGGAGVCGNAVIAYSGPEKQHDNGLIVMPQGNCKLYLSGSTENAGLTIRLWRSDDTYSLPAAIQSDSYTTCNNALHCNAQFTFTAQEHFFAYYVETSDGSKGLTKTLLSYECN